MVYYKTPPSPHPVPVDSEHLQTTPYDYCIVGTGVVQSILSAAISLTNKYSVIVCDGTESYGEEGGSVNLDELLSLSNERRRTGNLGNLRSLEVHSKTSLSHSVPLSTLQVDDDVNTPYGVGKIVAFPPSLPSHLKVRFQSWKATATLQKSSVSPLINDALRRAEKWSRSFSLPLTNRLLFCGGGGGVDELIRSGVSMYLEFKGGEGMFFVDGDGEIERVPCSKGDVFKTSLLTPMDKRRLMKLLQFSFDYGTQFTATTDPRTLNESSLMTGRALHRPQNKKVESTDVNAVESYGTFDAFLEGHFKIVGKLKDIVKYALVLDASSSTTDAISVAEGVKRLYTHLSSFGKFSGVRTAFLFAMYGAGELASGFCRCGAVNGGTYLLRRGVEEIIYQDSSRKLDCNLVNNVVGVVISGDEEFGEERRKTVKCNNIVLGAEEYVSLDNPNIEGTKGRHGSGRRLLRRISILDRAGILPVERSIVIFPPNTTNNTPNKNPIQCIVEDESLNVVPRNSTFEVAHFTMIVEDGQECDGTILEEAMGILLRKNNNISEIHHVCFSFAIDNAPDATPNNVTIIDRSNQFNLTFKESFEEAERIFRTILPQEHFLRPSMFNNRSSDGEESDTNYEDSVLEELAIKATS